MPQDVLLSRDLLPLKKGTLWSSTKSLLAKTWTGKWCTLQGATIVYSPDVRDSRTIATPLFTTPIRSITAINKSALHDNKELHALAITLSSGEVHTFYADSERDRNEWCVFFDQQVQRVCFADIYKLRDGPPLGTGLRLPLACYSNCMCFFLHGIAPVLIRLYLRLFLASCLANLRAGRI